MALATLVLTLTVAVQANASVTRQFRPVSATSSKVVFNVKKLKRARVVKAHVVYTKRCTTKSKSKSKSKRAKSRRSCKQVKRRTYRRKTTRKRTLRKRTVERAARKTGKLVVRVPAGAPQEARAPKLVVEVAALPSTSNRAPGQTGSCSVAWGSYGRDARPGACWRPYDGSSPFNQIIPDGAPSDPRSAAIVTRTLNFGPIQHILPGRAGTSGDYGRPLYFSQPSDPVYTVRCMKSWGTCPIEGEQVHIPGAARAAGGSDGHLTVIDQVTGWEYDFWQVLSKGPSGGEIRISWGGRTRIDGNGLGSRAVASNYGTAAGIIRAEELAAGRIDHALFINVSCDSGQAVFPADHVGATCSDTTNAPAMGQRFQLRMSDAEIDALNAPQWKKAILRAMARYGMFVGDTGGEIGIAIESGVSSTSFGHADPWVEFAKSVDAPYYAPDRNYVLNVRDGVDWRGRLRVVAPCVSQRTC